MTREEFKTYQGVFDRITYEGLERLYGKCFDKLKGPVNTGKEADVYLAEWKNEFVALKIYRILTRAYKNIDIYIRDDPRFKSIQKNPRKLIYEWTKKEYKNLKRIQEIGIRVPEPIMFNKNILAMEFIGTKDKASPLAKYQPPKQPEKWKNIIYQWVIKLWEEGEMVHGDLSEWNIINHKEKPVMIDVSQAVLKKHPLSIKLLKRDVSNITRWFNKQGINDNTLNEWLEGEIKKCTSTTY